MRPSARLHAVQDLLDPLCEGPDFLPVDKALANYFRKRRFIGSRDRRAIRDIFFMILHCWQVLSFSLNKAGGVLSGRTIVLTFLKLTGKLEDALFQEGEYGLNPLSEEEKAFLDKIDPALKAPDWAALNCPEWLFEKFQNRFGKAFAEELSALNERAPLDIRVNTLKTSFEAVKPDLEKLGFLPTKTSKIGFRIHEKPNISHCKIYENGSIEIQDEGSQVVTQMIEAKPGHQVMDLCAGAGGKTLAMAADMTNRGQIFAFDIDEGRLKNLKARAERAGVRNLQIFSTPETGPKRTEKLKEFRGKMDRVVLDVPCSGTGVWRRSPEARLRLTPEKLETYKNQQKSLLDEGWSMVKPGGRLIYITCSMVPEENEDQIKAFITNQKEATLIKQALFTPAVNYTDGFFIASLEKTGIEK